MASSVLKEIDLLKGELDELRPLPPEVVACVEQKLRIESNYHSNAVEGNALTLGETRSLILHGLTARGKPMRDHLDIQGHDQADKSFQNTGKTMIFSVDSSLDSEGIIWSFRIYGSESHALEDYRGRIWMR